MAKKRVCQACRDTHWVWVGERQLMCVRCPIPCYRCRAGGNGPYCENTPCSCECHCECSGLVDDKHLCPIHGANRE